MAEANEIYFTYKEIVESLVKKEGIHKGLWGLSIEFGLGAVNMKTNPEGTVLVPSGFLGVQRIGIRQYDTPSNLTVDAAEVNPLSGTTKRAKGRPKTKKKNS